MCRSDVLCVCVFSKVVCVARACAGKKGKGKGKKEKVEKPTGDGLDADMDAYWSVFESFLDKPRDTCSSLLNARYVTNRILETYWSSEERTNYKSGFCGWVVGTGSRATPERPSTSVQYLLRIRKCGGLSVCRRRDARGSLEGVRTKRVLESHTVDLSLESLSRTLNKFTSATCNVHRSSRERTCESKLWSAGPRSADGRVLDHARARGLGERETASRASLALSRERRGVLVA